MENHTGFNLVFKDVDVKPLLRELPFIGEARGQAAATANLDSCSPALLQRNRSPASPSALYTRLTSPPPPFLSLSLFLPALSISLAVYQKVNVPTLGYALPALVRGRTGGPRGEGRWWRKSLSPLSPSHCLFCRSPHLPSSPLHSPDPSPPSSPASQPNDAAPPASASLRNSSAVAKGLGMHEQRLALLNDQEVTSFK